jgi:FkbM family methyltransferase
MSSAAQLPLLIRLGFLWNRVGARGRGYVPRRIGQMFRGDREYIIETAHGAKLVLDLNNLEVYAPIYNADGNWEPHIAHTCRRILRDRDVFFDIGANAGMVTLETRAVLGDGISICAFEPQPSLAESLRRSIAVNKYGNIAVFECLLSDHDGIGDLYLTSHAIHASMRPREHKYKKISRPVWKIDTLVGTGRCPSPHVVKVDTEGAEMQIFQGMTDTIRSCGPSLVFEADENLERFGYKANDLLNFLSSLHDYQFYSIPSNGELRHWQPGIASDVLALGIAHRERISIG